jgi:hypothetical protein
MSVQKKIVKHTKYFLRVPIVNRCIFALRFFYYVRVRNRLVTNPDDSATFDPVYSKKMLLQGNTSDRPLSLIRPLSSIPHVEKGRVLSVGSRYETELLYLVGYGFDSKRIRGLDLFSYSPWIDSGNMHNMPYPDRSFDVIVLGWIVSYSQRPKKLAEEVMRVIADEGVIAIGVSYYSDDFVKAKISSGQNVIGDFESRLQTTSELLELFNPWVTQVIFRYDPPKETAESRCLVVFSVKK